MDTSTQNILLSQMAIPRVLDSSPLNRTGGRVGIVFPTVSRNNYMPIRSWTGIGVYPCRKHKIIVAIEDVLVVANISLVSGLMLITNTTLAFFHDACNRHDVAIQVSQKNDDGQFPIMTSSMFVYNSSQDNLIFNGLPNLGVVNPSQCGDMDCDGLKKDLVTDTDGSLFGRASSIFSDSEALWGSQQHGIGDFRIPRVALTSLTGQQVNINLTHPYRGISRTNSCYLRSAWGMYMCNFSTDYRMLIIESMDSDTEKRRVSPVAVMSTSGYIDLINGPQDQTICNGYSCQKRISTFMSIVQSGQTYEIYFSSTPPKYLRFRLLNTNTTIKCILAVYYYSLQQIDIYANTLYIPPTNRDLRYPGLMLLDQPNGVTLTSPAGSNFFNRTYQMAYFAIDGNTTIEVKMSPLLILSFGFPPMNPAAFFSANLVSNLAALLNISPDKIRRVNIVSASSNTRIRRQTSPVMSVQLQMELRDEPRTSTTAATGIRAEILANIAASIINRYQAGELQVLWGILNITDGIIPSNLTAQEPFQDFQVNLSVIAQLVLVTPPSDCRQQSPCTIQPVLIAYDVQGNIIQKLGSNDQPWQVQASLVYQPNVVLSGGIANYTNGQTQFTQLSLPDNGTQPVQFTMMLPYGVNGFMTMNLIVQCGNVSVGPAQPAGQQINKIRLVNSNESFSVSVQPIDSVTQLPLGHVQWGTWRWISNVTLYTLPSFNRQGFLVTNGSSRTNANLTAVAVTITNLGINGTGMFMLNICLNSSNNQYSITVLSNAILVATDKSTIATDPQGFSSNITSQGNFDALNASNQLEITRALLYNYLLSIGMPLISDMILIKGGSTTIVALFEVDPLPSSVASAVSTLLASPNAVSSLTFVSVNINSRSYSVSDSSSNNTNSSGGSGSNNLPIILETTIPVATALVATIAAIIAYVVYTKLIAANTVAPMANAASLSTSNVELIQHQPFSFTASPAHPLNVHVTTLFNPSPSTATQPYLIPIQ
ncbi:unnamed protein product [Rotaria magnacalcarata]|uniref:Uncharacterized protein n=1 Tax=Rotaria magnacalcarata TaxID=392030 RepID=A0A815A743_9BILA|nr:unnamed protein product [Rotaria magnacalcarata]CAF1483155.1 unnamed protein product [Rotaria magnacalcarata]